jgi:hypothetical protein
VKNITLSLFTISMLTLANCVIIGGEPNFTSEPSATPVSSFGPVGTANPTIAPTAIATPVPTVATASPSAVTKKGGIIKFIGTSVDWGTLGPAEKARFTVQDFEHQHLVYREVPSDPENGGEFDFTWDAPPAEISIDQTITLNINTKNNIVAENRNVNSWMDMSFQPNGFFSASPAELIRKGVGWFDNKLDAGTAQIRLKPVGINNETWNEDTKISIYVFAAHGPTLYYNYRLIRD